MNKLLSRLSVGVMKASKNWVPKQGPYPMTKRLGVSVKGTGRAGEGQSKLLGVDSGWGSGRFASMLSTGAGLKRVSIQVSCD